ncbi:MAG: biliverdin-producing heme oxygenase [cyanobacterium endosymbiont of Rhopalodia musculus]
MTQLQNYTKKLATLKLWLKMRYLPSVFLKNFQKKILRKLLANFYSLYSMLVKKLQSYQNCIVISQIYFSELNRQQYSETHLVFY